MTARAEAVSATDRRRALMFIAITQFLALTLWFSASAVAPQLEEQWRLSGAESTGLTLAVQIGFVVGAFASALLNLGDAIPTRRLFVVSALAGAGANALLVPLGPADVGLALVLRFGTGVALAGVYPSGLKVMAGWFKSGRGMALGVLVGALTVGSAAPHLVRGLGFDWQGVVVASTVLAVGAAAMMAWGVGDGPHEVPTQPFSWRQIGSVFRNSGFRLSTYGYLGHMWELYAMWTWTAAFLGASAAASGAGYGSIPTLTFAVIAVGGLGSWYAGRLADRRGRTVAAGGAMVVSGGCAVVTPLIFGAPVWVVAPVFLVWGFSVVADSAQFSAMVTETADTSTRGTALTLQTALGFLLTLITIRGVPLLADSAGWRWAFLPLAFGPAFGVAAMVRLRLSPWRARLAEGLG